MMQISVASTHLLTGDAVATMLLEYAAALMNKRKTATVDLRGYFPNGTPTRAVLLVGEHCPLVAVSLASDLGEPDNGHLVNEIADKIFALSAPAKTAEAPTTLRPYLDDLNT